SSFQPGNRRAGISSNEIPGVNVRSLRVRIESLRHHADDRLAPSGRPPRHPFADDAGIAPKDAPPQSITNDYRLRDVSLNDNFIGLKPSAEHRPDGEDLERVKIHLLQANALGATRTREGCIDSSKQPGNRVERLGVLSPGIERIHRYG